MKFGDQFIDWSIEMDFEHSDAEYTMGLTAGGVVWIFQRWAPPIYFTWAL